MMMRNRLATVVAAAGFGAFLLSFAAIEWTISYAFPSHQAEQQHAGPENSDTKNLPKCEERSFWKRMDCDPVAYFTGWLVGFTGILAASTIALWWVTWRAGIRQSNEIRILQRAYVAAMPGEIRPFHSGDGQLACNVILRNVGHLTATKVRWFIDAKLHPFGDITEAALIIGELIGTMVLPPGVDSIKGTTTPPMKTKDFITYRDVEGDPSWLYIFGRIEYVDGFGKDRWTNFCVRYSLAFAKAVAQRTGGIVSAFGDDALCLPPSEGRYHEYGNKTDED